MGVRWYDYVTNASILTRTVQPLLTTTIRKLRLGAFGHICRLQPGTQAIDILASTPPASWRRPRGRPPLRWADQIIKDTQMSLSDAVTATHDRPSWRSLVQCYVSCDASNLSKHVSRQYTVGRGQWSAYAFLKISLTIFIRGRSKSTFSNHSIRRKGAQKKEYASDNSIPLSLARERTERLLDDGP